MEKVKYLDSGSVTVASSIEDSRQTSVVLTWKVSNYSGLKQNAMYLKSLVEDGNSWTFRLMKTKYVLFLMLHTKFVEKNIKSVPKNVAFFFAAEDKQIECNAKEIANGVYVAELCNKLISDLRAQILHDDTLNIYCKHNLTKVSHTTTAVPYGQWRYKTCVDDLLEVMNKLFQSSEGSDLILMAGGEEFRVHKIILAARSKHFARLFEGENITEHRIHSTAAAVREVLRYMYTTKLNEVDLDDMIKVLYMAEDFEITGLAKKCEEVLKVYLSHRTIIKIFYLAREENMTSLLKALIIYYHAHKNNYSKNKTYGEFKQEVHQAKMKLEKTEGSFKEWS